MQPTPEKPASAAERTAYVLRQRFAAANETASREGAVYCDKTFVVAGGITCGLVIPPDGYRRSMKADDPTQTDVTFLLEDRADIEFRSIAPERITTAELVRRMADVEWIKAHPDHPLAYVYWSLRNYAALVRAIRNHKPLMMFRRGARKAYVLVGGDRAENRFILERARFTDAEIEEILDSVSPMPPPPPPPPDGVRITGTPPQSEPQPTE